MAKFFKPLYNDIVFNYIFSKEEFALDFINTFFNKRYKNIKLRSEDVLPKTEYHDKAIRGDIVAEFSNAIYNLEAYTSFKNSNVEKSKQYASRLYGTQIKRGKRYKPKKVIQLNICKECNVEDIINKYGILNYKNGKYDILRDDYLIYILCLDNLKEENYNVGVSDRLSKYLKLFKGKNIEEMKKISEGDEILMSITQCLEEFLNDEETKELFDRELWKAREHEEIGLERGKKIGKEQGLKIGEKRGLKLGKEEGLKLGKELGKEEGLVEAANNIALNLLKIKTDIKDVTYATGLTEQEVLKLQKTLQ